MKAYIWYNFFSFQLMKSIVIYMPTSYIYLILNNLLLIKYVINKVNILSDFKNR